MLFKRCGNINRMHFLYKGKELMNSNKKEKSKNKFLFLFVFLLAVSVIATSIITVRLMNKYYFDASGAIDISPNNQNAQQEQQSDGQLNTDVQNENDGTQSSGGNGSTVGGVEMQEEHKNADFTASSDGIVWTTNTKVDIFKSSYSNKHGQMTVKSDDGDKVVAPGTSNSFVFKLSNTGEVPLSYELDIDAYITPDGLKLPVKARLSRYDNRWLVGDKDSWVDTAALNDAEDSAVLGVRRYMYYTLDWEWPFEEDDKYDTKLGNMAVDEDLTLTIVIKTRATAAEGTGQGITLPNTGDNSSIVVWGTVAVISLVVMVVAFIFILFARNKNEEEDSSAEDSQNE